MISVSLFWPSQGVNSIEASEMTMGNEAILENTAANWFCPHLFIFNPAHKGADSQLFKNFTDFTRLFLVYNGSLQSVPAEKLNLLMTEEMSQEGVLFITHDLCLSPHIVIAFLTWHNQVSHRRKKNKA